MSNGWCGTSATFQSFLCQLEDENVCTRYSPPCVWFLFRFRCRLILWGDWWHDRQLKLGHLWPYRDCTTCGTRHLEGRNLGPSYNELTGGVEGDWALKLTTEYSWSWAYSTLHICSYTGWEQDLLSQPLLLLLSASPLSLSPRTGEVSSWCSCPKPKSTADQGASFLPRISYRICDRRRLWEESQLIWVDNLLAAAMQTKFGFCFWTFLNISEVAQQSMILCVHTHARDFLTKRYDWMCH